MKEVLYLLHGQSELVQNHFHLNDFEIFDCIFSTYDKEIEGAYFFKDSTWGEGRNALLKIAIERGILYEYYVFINDDIGFLKGDFDLFAKQLIKFKPAVATPIIYHKNMESIIKLEITNKISINIFPIFQITKFSDGQFIAFHKNSIKDNILFPIQTQYDSISWWFSSSTQQILAFNFYGNRFIQFNNIITENKNHREYPKNDFFQIQEEWFRKEFKKPIIDHRKFRYNILSINNLRKIYNTNNNKIPIQYFLTFWRVFWSTIFYKKNKYFTLSPKKVKSLLNPSSDILNNYQG